MKFKRNIYFLLCTIIIFFGLTFVYEKIIVNSNLIEVLYIKKPVKRGEKISSENVNKIKIEKSMGLNFITNISDNECFSNSYEIGNIVLREMIIAEESYMKIEENKEKISIKLDDSAAAVSYQIEKGSIVNIFYSSKLSDIKNIYNLMQKEKIVNNEYENGYVTIKLLENIKVLNCYNKLGENASDGEVIDTIMLELNKEEILTVNALKNSGEFRVTIVR